MHGWNCKQHCFNLIWKRNGDAARRNLSMKNDDFGRTHSLLFQPIHLIFHHNLIGSLEALSIWERLLFRPRTSYTNRTAPNFVCRKSVNIVSIVVFANLILAQQRRLFARNYSFTTNSIIDILRINDLWCGKWYSNLNYRATDGFLWSSPVHILSNVSHRQISTRTGSQVMKVLSLTFDNCLLAAVDVGRRSISLDRMMEIHVKGEWSDSFPSHLPFHLMRFCMIRVCGARRINVRQEIFCCWNLEIWFSNRLIYGCIADLIFCCTYIFPSK